MNLWKHLFTDFPAGASGACAKSRMRGETAGSRNVKAANEKNRLANSIGVSSRTGAQHNPFKGAFTGSSEGQTLAIRHSKRLVSEGNKVGTGGFFGGKKWDATKHVPVGSRTNGTALQGAQASKLRSQSDEDGEPDIEELPHLNKSRKGAIRVQGAAAASSVNANSNRLADRQRSTTREPEEEIEPDSDEDAEKDPFLKQYVRKEKISRQLRKTPEAREGHAERQDKGKRDKSGGDEGRGSQWQLPGARTRKRSESAEDDGAELGLPPSKRNSSSHQNGKKKDKDPEYQVPPLEPKAKPCLIHLLSLSRSVIVSDCWIAS
jgi:hypothetical protein